MDRFHLTHDDRQIELLQVVPGFLADPRLALVVDGEDRVWVSKASWGRTRLEDGDVIVDVYIGPRGVKRAVLVTDVDRLDLYPPAGTRLARMDAWGRRNPTIWALRHALGGTTQAILAIVGIGVLLRLLPDLPLPSIPLPDIPLPDINLPSIPLPDIDLPDIEVPGWIQWLGRNAKWLIPLMVGIALTIGELARRRARTRRAEDPPENRSDDR